jgi:hypothetical protein
MWAERRIFKRQTGGTYIYHCLSSNGAHHRCVDRAKLFFGSINSQDTNQQRISEAEAFCNVVLAL